MQRFTPNNKVQPFQLQLSPVTSNDTTHTSSQPKPRPTVPKDKTQSFQPQPTSNHKPSQTKPETALPKYKTQSSQPQPELVTFDSKMKERHNLVRNIMTVLRQQKKENADTYKPKISHQRNRFQSLVYIFQIRRFSSLSLSGWMTTSSILLRSYWRKPMLPCRDLKMSVVVWQWPLMWNLGNSSKFSMIVLLIG